ncbi:MAG: hypothetical protein WA138_16060 [Parvibaculum sp.]
MKIELEKDKIKEPLKVTESLEQPEYVKLVKPVFPAAFNQGPEPKGISISYPNKKYFLEYGTVFKISLSCDKENKIADLTTKPYPLLNYEFYKHEKNQFEVINLNLKNQKE